jgi:ATP-dependent helicase HrpB
LRRLPLHPRLGRLFMAAGGSSRAALACARLAEGDGWSGSAPATSSDLILLADDVARASPGARRAARELQDLARSLGISAPAGPEDVTLRQAVLLAYPDRVAQRRSAGAPRLLLASGQGATLARESGVHDAAYLVAVDVGAGAGGQEPLVRLASRVEREWLTPTHRDVEHRWLGGRVRAFERDWYGRLLLAEREVPPDAETARALRITALRDSGLGEAGERLLRRLRFAGLGPDRDALIESAADLDSLDSLGTLLPGEKRRDLDRLAPEQVTLPSGRSTLVDYREDGTAAISVKLQELFGLADTPRLGPRQEPLLILLLAPNGRPVQTTRDLRSFWERTYPEVRRELRGRYPRHPWPEDPWTATPTARAKPRGR